MRRIIIPLFMLMLNQPSALGQWQPSANGLPNTYALDMVTVGNELLVATGNQIYRSDIEGSMWTSSSAGLPTNDLVMVSIIVHGGRVFCGSNTSIYYSDDDGLTWAESINVGRRIMEFAEVGNALFAVTRGAGCLRSVDNGVTWLPVTTGLPADSINDILTVGSMTYIGSRFFGLYESQDLGLTWAPLSTGEDSINVIEIVSDGNILYVGLREWPSRSHYLKRSTDGGQTWVILTSPVFPGISDDHLLADAGICIGTTVIMGSEQLVRSTDLGETWNGFGVSGCMYLGLHETDDHVFLLTNCFAGSPAVFRIPKSSIIGINEDESVNVPELRVVPNPTTDQTTVLLRNGTCRSYTLHDAMGREVASEMFAAPSVRFEVGLGNLSAGIYTLHAQTPAGPAVERVVKE